MNRQIAFSVIAAWVVVTIICCARLFVEGAPLYVDNFLINIEIYSVITGITFIYSIVCGLLAHLYIENKTSKSLSIYLVADLLIASPILIYCVFVQSFYYFFAIFIAAIACGLIFYASKRTRQNKIILVAAFVLVCLFPASLYYNWKLFNILQNTEYEYEIPYWSDQEKEIITRGYRAIIENGNIPFSMYPYQLKKEESGFTITFSILERLRENNSPLAGNLMDGCADYHFDKEMKLIKVVPCG